MSEKSKRRKPEYLKDIISVEDIIANIACGVCRAEFDITKEFCTNCGATGENIVLFWNVYDKECELCQEKKIMLFPKKVKYKNYEKIMHCCIQCVSDIYK